MSIQGFRRFLVRGPLLKTILYILIGVFVIGLALIFTPQSGIMSRQSENGEAAGSGDVIAKVNGKPLTREAYERIYQEQIGQMMAFSAQYGQSISVDQLWRYRLQAVKSAAGEQLLLQEAAAQGIRVSKREVGQRMAQLVDLQLAQLKQGAKGDELAQRYGMVYSQTTKTPRATMSERQFRKWLTGYVRERYQDQVKTELITGKLREKVAPKPAVTEAEARASYDRLTLRILTVALKPEGKPERTEEQARARAEELLARAKEGADLAQLVQTESDDPRAKENGGLQTRLLPSSMPPEWQKAVAGLKPGELAPEPLKEGIGYRLIKLEKVEQDLPKDFEKNKQKELDRFASQKQSEAWSRYQQGLQAKAKIDMVDPEMRAYEAKSAGNTEQAIKELKKATASAERIGPAGASSVYYLLAIDYAAHKQWKEAASAYESADSYLAREESGLSGARTVTLMGMARCHQNLGDAEEALVWYRAASDAAVTPSVHEQLAAIYQQMGQQQDAQHEREWLDNFEKQRAEQEEAQRKAMEAQQKEAAARAGRSAPQPAAAPPTAAPKAPAPPAPKPAAKPTPPPEKPATSTPAPAPAGGAAAPGPAAER